MKDNDDSRRLSRNDPCWCGSGKKYKKCHMNSDLEKDVALGRGIKPAPGVIIKTASQIEGIRKASKLTRDVLDVVEQEIKAGMTTSEIDDIVHEYTISHGGIPATLNYNGFPKSVCTSLNNVICHGIPDKTILKDGDIINVDCTSIIDGFYGDASRMFMIGNVSAEAEKLVRVSKECLDIGIDQVKPYADIGEIGFAIEQHAKKHGFSIVRDYGGHGIGIRFHEEPHVHHYGSRKKGIILLPNMVFTIEPMVNAGRYSTRLLSDGWTVITADGSLSAQWEHTVLVTDDCVEILT